jgi:hypothetical protein
VPSDRPRTSPVVLIVALAVLALLAVVDCVGALGLLGWWALAFRPEAPPPVRMESPQLAPALTAPAERQRPPVPRDTTSGLSGRGPLGPPPP